MSTLASETPHTADNRRATRVSPVNVCYLIDRLGTAGTEKHVLRLIAGLDRSLFAPHLALLDGDNSDSRALEPADCPVTRLGVKSLSNPTTFLKLIRFARQLRRWNIHILQTFFPESTHFGVSAGVLARVPAIIRTKRDLFPWPGGIRGQLSRSLHALYNRFFVCALIANSHACRQAAFRLENPPPREVVVIENGVNFAAFELVAFEPPFAGERKEARIGVVANLRPEKRLDILLDAVKILLDRGHCLSCTIAGEGPQRRSLEELIARNGRANTIQLCGIVRDIPQFLSTLDIAVLCSETEGASNSLIEYMLSGRAIVATAVGGNQEMIVDGVNGLLVPPDDSHALAAAISRFLENPHLAAVYSRNAVDTARDRYSLTSEIVAHQELYLRLLSAA